MPRSSLGLSPTLTRGQSWAASKNLIQNSCASRLRGLRASAERQRHFPFNPDAAGRTQRVQPGISDIPGYTYNLGDTGTHEVGHYLGLAHTFEGHCSAYNDGVADTPPERSPDFNCTSGRDTCSDRGGLVLLDPIHNFMDYSDDVCLNTFTGGQAERMNLQWVLYRQGK
jgi:hypothetical protein